MGKAYSNKRPKAERPIGDFYSTPKSLVWIAEDIIRREFGDEMIIDPCSGMGAIDEALVFMDFKTGLTNDLHNKKAANNFDYLENSGCYNVYLKQREHIITNPPFSLWDEFVNKAKTHCNKFMFIGRLNYLSTVGRSQSGIWDNLKGVYPFNRYVDYQTPFRDDGLFHVGAMATAWFLWEKNWSKPPIMQVLDVQKYAKLGQFKKKSV